MSAEAWAIVSTLLLGIAGALVIYFRNIAKRSDPAFQKQLEDSLLTRLDEERNQRKIEIAEVKKHSEEERAQHKAELAEIKVENRAELVAAKLDFKNERDGLLQRLAALELKFDALRTDSEARYQTDTAALILRVDVAEKRVDVAERRVEVLEKVIEELRRTVAGLTAENTTLKREAGRDEK